MYFKISSNCQDLRQWHVVDAISIHMHVTLIGHLDECTVGYIIGGVSVHRFKLIGQADWDCTAESDMVFISELYELSGLM